MNIYAIVGIIIGLLIIIIESAIQNKYEEYNHNTYYDIENIHNYLFVQSEKKKNVGKSNNEKMFEEKKYMFEKQ